MIIQSRRSLLNITSQCKIIPIVESRVQFTQVFDSKHVNSVLLRHCNLFDFTTILSEAQKRSLSVYVNISPGLVTPYITAQNKELFPLPFIASGLIHTPEQVQSVLRSGAIGVAVSRPELWL